MKSFRTAIVVGASSGIGEAVVRRLAAGGCKVACLARRSDRLREMAREIQAAGGPRFDVHEHDVRNGAEVPKLWDAIERELGTVDLLVFAAGILPPNGESEYSFEKDREVIAVNLLGAIAWCDEAALRMEAARHGTIVGISSVAGDRGRRGHPAYGTSKAGMTAFLESLRNRLHRHGVDVVTIRSGYVHTEMTAGLGLPPWATISASKAAALIIDAARSGPVDRYVPRPWGFVMFIIRSIPSFIFRKLSV